MMMSVVCSGLHESLRMTVAIPLLNGVPPESEYLRCAPSRLLDSYFARSTVWQCLPSVRCFHGGTGCAALAGLLSPWAAALWRRWRPCGTYTELRGWPACAMLLERCVSFACVYNCPLYP